MSDSDTRTVEAVQTDETALAPPLLPAVGKEKSPWLYGVMIGVWIAVLALSTPFFYAAVAASTSWTVAAARSLIVGSLAVFWLFGFYNIAVTLFGYLHAPDADRVPYGEFRDTPVAIVYPTYNDFSEDHLRESMRQTHETVHTYIVDDSTDPGVVTAIDAFESEHDDVTVVRREGRDGYKAGALNHALATVIDEPYFALMDADEVLPPRFIEETFRYFADDGVGFVQGNHDYNRDTATRFGRALGVGVDVHWDIYQPPRNAHGFVMLLGHGALIRRDVWSEIDGFPELVSEDLAFATRARGHGYRGVFAPEVDCLEDFPVDYEAFRTRHKKWTAGSIEYIREELPRFLRSDTPLVEKLDVLIPTLQLPLTVVFVAYIVAVGVLEFTTGRVIPGAAEIPWFLGVVTVGTLLSPLYCYLISLRDRPRKLVHFVATSTTVYCSVAITAVVHGAQTLLPWNAAEFLTTPKQSRGTVDIRQYAWTVAAGVATLALASKAGWLVGAAGLAWAVAPAIAYYNDEEVAGRLARTLALVPVVIMFAGVAWGVAILV